MRIDRKTNGVWVVGKVDRTDNIAYHLYLYNQYKDFSKISQSEFIRKHNESNKFNIYYKLAKLEIRKEKIIKLKKIITK